MEVTNTSPISLRKVFSCPPFLERSDRVRIYYHHNKVLENKFRHLFVDLPTDEPDRTVQLGAEDFGEGSAAKSAEAETDTKVGVDLQADFSR